jgi:hypothetical protein
MAQLYHVYNFIGANKDRSKLATFYHATGAISVFIFGIIYLRSRRLDIMTHLNTPLDELENASDTQVVPEISITNPRDPLKPMDEIKEEDAEVEDEDEEGSSFEQEIEGQHFIWKMYDKVVNAFTSEFVVLNICRLGLGFWILRYN